MTSDEKVELLFAKDQIADLIYSYCQMVDRQDYDRFPELYHPGAMDEHGFNADGRADTFIEMLKPIYAEATAIQHQVSNCYIKVEGAYAEAETYLWSTQVMRDPEGRPYEMVTGGRYMDKLEKRDDVWKFSHRHLVIDWSIRNEVRNDIGDPMISGFTLGRASLGDPSFGYFRLFRPGQR